MTDALLLRQVRWYVVKRTAGHERGVYDIIADTKICGDIIAKQVRTVSLARRIVRLHNKAIAP